VGGRARRRRPIPTNRSNQQNAGALEHPQVAITLWVLGFGLRDLGELPAAQVAYQRALGILEQFFSPNRLLIIRVLTNLGVILWDLGQLQETKLAHERALALSNSMRPSSQSDINLITANLATLQAALELPDSAASLPKGQQFGYP
jgi:tetratricopeptide (TPR) repeat protein